MDTLTPAERSERMSRVRGKDTKPELLVRRLVHKMGYRYRLHVRKLPGIPDLVFPSRSKVVFVHGCFWHRHAKCARWPKSKLDFWQAKLEGNKKRDDKNRRALRRLGWGVAVVWECEVGDAELLAVKLQGFLEN